MRNRTIVAGATAIVMAFAMTACGTTDDPPEPTPPPDVTLDPGLDA